MEKDFYRPSIIDLAYEIIDLHEQNKALLIELKHYKELNEINTEQIRKNTESTKANIGLILNAAIDPDSAIINSVRNDHSTLLPFTPFGR